MNYYEKFKEISFIIILKLEILLNYEYVVKNYVKTHFGRNRVRGKNKMADKIKMAIYYFCIDNNMDYKLYN